MNGVVLKKLDGRENVSIKSELHLAVSMRSFRAENLSNFVHKVLDLDIESAKEIYKTLNNVQSIFQLSIVLTLLFSSICPSPVPNPVQDHIMYLVMLFL